uniref:DAGKc domain-containing protein n=1 Tax=Meloidogyne javanica TaxID=6303 RepID=A0A915MGY0_MELJA
MRKRSNQKQEGNLNKIYPTTASQIKETTKTTTEEEESSELTDSSTFSTTITEDLQQQTTIPLIDTTSPFMEEIIEKPQLKHIPICPEPPLEEINEINECEGGERSNTIVESIGSATKGILKQQKTCFKETPPIPQSKFTFLLFRNLQSVPPPQENVKNGKFNKTFIELFIGAHLKPTDYTWAIEESQRTMKRMTELTNTEYPLPRLTIVSSPLGAGNDAMGGLGLVQIRDSW